MKKLLGFFFSCDIVIVISFSKVEFAWSFFQIQEQMYLCEYQSILQRKSPFLLQGIFLGMGEVCTLATGPLPLANSQPRQTALYCEKLLHFQSVCCCRIYWNCHSVHGDGDGTLKKILYFSSHPEFFPVSVFS